MKTVQQMLDLKPTTLCPALYKWSIKAAAMLRQQAEQIESLKAECETRKAYGDEQTEFAIKNANERDALKALADNPRNTPFGKKAEKLADDWLAANAPGGWIDDLRNKCEALETDYDALKADAERWKTIKPHFYFDNEGGHGFWNCSISSESWTVDGIIPDAAIDAMKGAT